MPKLLFVVNYDFAFLSHRKAIACRAKELGFDIVVAAKATGHENIIKELGFKFIPMPGSPTGMNPIEELKTLKFLVDLYRKERPDIVHHVVLKNVMWGSLASRITKVPGVLNAICGLGVMFNMPLSKKAYLIMRLIKIGSRRNNILTIFQNDEDKNLFIENHVINESDCLYTKGSGVDLQEYAYQEPVDHEKVIIVFSGRMVEEKGVKTLVEAAKMLKPEYADKLEFRLCGALSTNPRAISKEWLDENCDGEYIKWLGNVENMPEMLRECDIVAFPSKYREGVPRSSIEACAIGRPIVTTDSVGCRDTVDDGVNGYIVEKDDVVGFAEKLSVLINDKDLRHRMGIASRKKAEREFNVDHVVDVHIKAYNELLKNSGKNA